MNDTDRRIVESPIYQGTAEQVAYTLTTTPWGSSPSGVSVALYDADGTNVTSSHQVSGSASASGDTITSWVVGSLDAGAYYQFVWQFTVSSNVMTAWADLIAQKH